MSEDDEREGTAPERDPEQLNQEELIAGLALDALDDPDQESRARQLIRSDPEAQQRYREYREVSGQLALAGAITPPPELKDRVLAQLGAQARPEPAQSAPEASTANAVQAQERFAAGPRKSARRWLMAAAAAAAIAIAVPSVIAVTQHQELVAARSDAQVLEQVLSGADARIVKGQLSSGSGRVSVATSQAGSALVAADLPRLESGSTYQLWTIGADKSPRSAGLMGSGTDSLVFSAVAPGTTVALTVEPSGGSEQPTTKPVLALSI